MDGHSRHTHTLVGERAMEATVRLPWYRSATLVKPVATASGGLRPGLCASPHTVTRHPFDSRNTHCREKTTWVLKLDVRTAYCRVQDMLIFACRRPPAYMERCKVPERKHAKCAAEWATECCYLWWRGHEFGAASSDRTLGAGLRSA
jgi:hypothetical protein